MNSVLYEYPSQAAFNRVVPKTKIYAYGKPGRKIREQLVSQVNQIVWQYKLSPETINLPARSGVLEIQIFRISLKTGEFHEDIMRCIDKVVAFPIFFELIYNSKIKLMATYKRPNETDSSKCVVDNYFKTDWLPEDTQRSPLPVSLNMAGLYEQMLQQLIPLPPRKEEPLKEHVARMNEIRSKEIERDKIDVCLKKEIQFNRKVDINRQLREINKELKALQRK